MHLFTNPIVLLALTVTSVRASPIVCFQDNPSRALNRFSKEAASFCPKYLAGSSATPYWVAEFSAPQISSACSCYESKTGLHPVTPTPTPSQKPATTSVQISKKPTLSSKKPTVVVSHVPSSTNAATPKATSKTLAATSTSTKTSIKPLATPIVPKSTNSNVGKRGLLYDYTSSDYSKFYKGSNKVTFGSDWHATRGETGATLDPSMAFIPTLTVDKGSLLNTKWLTTITGLIAGGVDIVFA